MGVVTHYAITKLYDIIVCLREKKRGSVVTMGTTFFNPQDRNLIDEWRPLLRVLHLGGSGDAFAQREFLHLRIYMLSFDFLMHSIFLDLIHCFICWLLIIQSQLVTIYLQAVLHTVLHTSSWQDAPLNTLPPINPSKLTMRR
jgi:hypothetical protein